MCNEDKSEQSNLLARCKQGIEKGYILIIITDLEIIYGERNKTQNMTTSLLLCLLPPTTRRVRSLIATGAANDRLRYLDSAIQHPFGPVDTIPQKLYRPLHRQSGLRLGEQ